MVLETRLLVRYRNPFSHPDPLGSSVREGRIPQGKSSADREATKAHTRLEVIIEWLLTRMGILNS